MARILVKYGGNAMLDDHLQSEVIRVLVDLKRKGHEVILVHGGGPFIAEQLGQAGIESEFVEGHRKTSPEAMTHVEMALKGRVNGQLVSLFNRHQSQAIGLSGKDVQLVRVTQRMHTTQDENGHARKVSLGRVGDVEAVNSDFLLLLLQRQITPVIACIGTDEEGRDYNINADMMAGHIAGALAVDHFLVLTDIDGLRKDVHDPSTHIDTLTIAQARALFGNSIQGGMIPKIEACILALEKGAREASIINGTQARKIQEKLMTNHHVGTNIIP